ncbi:MAG: hypothetical protein Hyperionvirus2_119 [Hyperionvirus sp.]|uniref:Uncharacterized protein n=1 Tax=Hyperionvirus sp. TaxID=2487770 RepID=A0A3G5A990_9VIRU|nr:MAG: hypothetical protein Hyperionvirus2_119 [Hyperionvirus sp.]
MAAKVPPRPRQFSNASWGKHKIIVRTGVAAASAATLAATSYGFHKYLGMKNYLKENNTLILQNEDMISFLQQYESLDKNRDIIIKIHHTGGQYERHIWAANYLLREHKGSGKLIAHVPFLAQSGGCMIMLCCDEIIINKFTAITPTDPLLNIDPKFVPCRDIIANSKKGNVGIQSARWHSDLFTEECKALVKNLANSRKPKWNEATEKKIYEELFSGKYSHAHVFTPEELKNFGLPITVEPTDTGKLSIPWFLREDSFFANFK